MRRYFLPLASVIAIIGLLLSSCVMQSWDVPIPGVTPSAVVERPQDSPQISLYIPEYLSEGPSSSKHVLLPPPHMVVDSLKKKLEGQNELGVFQVTRTPPEKGVFCSLRLEEAEVPPVTAVWSVLPAFTLWLLPFYDRTPGYGITYELFVDAKLKKRYQYQVRGKLFEWFAAVFAVPFMSGNWHFQLEPTQTSVNDDLVQGLWQTAKLFREDARRDGFLP